jgi:hypothetical protein
VTDTSSRRKTFTASRPVLTNHKSTLKVTRSAA